MIGDIAHVCNRGVDKRKIFNNRENYERFRDNLFLLNNIKGKIRTKRKDIFEQRIKLPDRNKLVEILKWSLMPNHFHLLLYEKVNGGILEFTKRLGNAYTKYFNLKVGERSGYLFQNSAKIITIGDEKHFPYLPIYIDLNAGDLVSGDVGKKMKFLKTYEWSSLKNYYGDKEDIEIINPELFYEIFGTSLPNYEKDLEGFLKDRERLENELYLKGVNLAG
ncbi:MAG: transposase [Candidatus Zambryskibacteria bacterium]|nr:transposase [Candidatus Zambryskibacteria bacterium]